MNQEELQEELEAILPAGFVVDTNKQGEIVILTGLKEDDDGELIPLDVEEIDVDPNLDPLDDEEEDLDD